MRFSRLEIAGFRGVRDPVKLCFASGFTVISGRNGTGKSSVCDALEFALTGTITKYADSTEKGENVGDYIWWRGKRAPEERYVSLELIDDQDQKVTVTRRPDGATVSNADIASLLCDQTVDADKTPLDVCRTSIIRDEFITRLSVDLPEPDRFNFVKAAVGSASFGALETKLKNAQKVGREKIRATEREYERCRDRVKELLVDLSKAKAEVARAEHSATAEKRLRDIAGDSQSTFGELLLTGRKLAPESRIRVDALNRLEARVQSLLKQESDISGPSLRARQTQLAHVVAEQNSALARLRDEIATIGNMLRGGQEEEATISSLAQLCEHGSRLGVRDGKCPLCGSFVSEDNFKKHIQQIDSQVAQRSRSTAEVTKRLADFEDQSRQASAALSAAQGEINQLSLSLELVTRERASLAKELDAIGVVPADMSPDLLEKLATERTLTRERLATIESSLAVLEASGAHARVAELEKDLTSMQHTVVTTERRLTRQQGADKRIEQAILTLKRVGSEIVDDRLAAISPLLEELYLRLRPHVDWPEIRYLIRGDTRRFLSLRVGSDLNLRFMFSSGQRRAAGLAFLMAVGLSRPWCRLQSLVFDDPVQHIDDFRALHLVESLSALRQSGRQIICTVEDAALAELLTRRLRSSVDDEGTLVEMDYESGRGAFVSRLVEIVPFAREVLRSA